MSIVIRSIVIYFIVFNWTSVHAASFEQEKALIDAHLNGDIRAHIQAIVDYTHMAMKQDIAPKCDGHVELAFAKFEDTLSDDDEVTYSYMSKVVYGGLVLMNNLLMKEENTWIDILETLDIASVLLSPQLMKPDCAFVRPEYSLYKRAIQNRDRLYVAGSYLLGDLDEDKVMSSINPMRGKIDAYTMTAKHFLPMAFLGDMAMFSERGFLYALSKGVFLFGLTSSENDAHGRLYHMPATLFTHDMAHVVDIIRPIIGAGDSRVVIDEKILTKVAENIIQITQKLYYLVYETNLFNEQERPKAQRAAFYLIHENQIYMIMHRLAQPPVLGTSPTYFSLLTQELINTLQVRLNVAGCVGLQVLDSLRFHKRLACDYAKMYVELFPESEAEIFGMDPTTDRSYVYDGAKVCRLSLDFVHWFYEKIKGHMS